MGDGAPAGEPPAEWQRRKPDCASLEQLGYKFNTDGELRCIQDSSRFRWRVRDPLSDRVTAAMTEEVYAQMCLHLDMHMLPVHDAGPAAPPDAPFLLATRGFADKKQLLVLIHGSTARGGQWARKLILNEGLRAGSMSAHVVRARENDWGCVVFDVPTTPPEGRELPDSLVYGQKAWERYVSTAVGVERIHVIVHADGGDVLSHILSHVKDARVHFVALANSVLSPAAFLNNPHIMVCNWSSRQDASFVLQGNTFTLPAGTSEYHRVPLAALDSMFYVFERIGECAAGEAGWRRLLRQADMARPRAVDERAGEELVVVNDVPAPTHRLHRKRGHGGTVAVALASDQGTQTADLPPPPDGAMHRVRDIMKECCVCLDARAVVVCVSCGASVYCADCYAQFLRVEHDKYARNPRHQIKCSNCRVPISVVRAPNGFSSPGYCTSLVLQQLSALFGKE